MSAPPIKASRELCDAFDLLGDPIKRKAVLDALHYKSMGHTPCRICLCITTVSSDGTCESCAHDAPPSYQQSMESSSSAAAASVVARAGAAATAAAAASSASVPASSAAAASNPLPVVSGVASAASSFPVASPAASPSSGSVVHAPGGPIGAPASYHPNQPKLIASSTHKRQTPYRTKPRTSYYACASCASARGVEYNEDYRGWLCRYCNSRFNVADDDDSIFERDIPMYTETQATERNNTVFAFPCKFCGRKVSRFEASVISHTHRKLEVCESCN